MRVSVWMSAAVSSVTLTQASETLLVFLASAVSLYEDTHKLFIILSKTTVWYTQNPRFWLQSPKIKVWFTLNKLWQKYSTVVQYIVLHKAIIRVLIIIILSFISYHFVIAVKCAASMNVASAYLSKPFLKQYLLTFWVFWKQTSVNVWLKKTKTCLWLDWNNCKKPCVLSCFFFCGVCSRLVPHGGVAACLLSVCNH